MKGFKKVFFITIFIILFCAVIVVVCYKGVNKLLNDRIQDINSSKATSETTSSTTTNNGNSSNSNNTESVLIDETLIELSDIVTADVNGAKTTYTADESINIILDNDSIITDITDELSIPKSFLQSILLKELSTQDSLDNVADAAVENYYKEVEEKGYSNKKSDSSTGLGQIFALTAINSYNNLVVNGIIDGKKMSNDDVSTRKDVWYKLKDDTNYNITYVAYAIRSNSVDKGYKDLSSCDEEQRKKLFASYNGSGAAATEYGKIVEKYYEKFEEYN